MRHVQDGHADCGHTEQQGEGSLRQLPPDRRARAGDLIQRSDSLAPESLVDLNSALVADVIVIATDAGSSLEDTPVHVHLQGSGAPAFIANPIASEASRPAARSSGLPGPAAQSHHSAR